MIVFVTFLIVWLLIPIIGEFVQHVTTKPLAKVSMEVDGFWDYIGGEEGTRRILMADANEITRMNADHPLSSAVEPPKGDWKNG